MNQEYKLYRISQLLSRFREQVKILNSNGEFSINIHAENILINILNLIYDCDLENVNYSVNKTYPSIDLRDKNGNVAFQITSTANFVKIRNTLNKFIKNGTYKKFKKLFIFIITEKQSRYDQSKIDSILKNKFVFKVSQIIDHTDIYKILNAKNSLIKIEAITDLLEKQFSDKNILDKWDIYCKGLNDYDNYICKFYKYLDIKGFSPKINNKLVKIELSSIYVPLELVIEDYSTQTKLFTPKKILETTPEKALHDYNKLVILGDPGSGKSTILKYICYKICCDRLSNKPIADLVPIIIKGSEYAKYFYTTGKPLAEFIIDQIDKKYENLFLEALETKKLFVLIDGIDEINGIRLRQDVCSKINSFISQYSDIKIIVSSRIVGYQESRLSGYFYHFQVKGFNITQIENFAENWYKSIAENSDNDRKLARIKANELINAIVSNNSVLRMANNPLLATIIALIHYQGSKLPERRASLYDIATSTFLENWVRQRETEKNSNFDKESLIEILSPVAFYIQDKYSTGLIAENELRELLEIEYKKIYPHTSTKEVKKELNILINFLREDAGFLFEKGLNEDGESLFGFVHLTFQEYFAAIEFVAKWKEGNLNKTFHKYLFNSNWSEVIILTASLFRLSDQTRIGRKLTTNFVNDILNSNDLLPEMYTSLKLTLDILKDEVEIDFKIVNNIIDKIFYEILIKDENEIKGIHVNYNNISYFIHKLGEIIQTKTYHGYLLERIINEINTGQNDKLIKNLIYVLMGYSDNNQIKQYIIKILKSNNNKYKKYIFDYNVVYPIAPIVKTPEFYQALIKYINSKYFIDNYKNIPIQFMTYFDRIELFENRDENFKKILPDYIKTIKSINNIKIREDLINYMVFSIGIEKLENIKKYVKVINKEFPHLKLNKINSHIEDLEKLKSYNLEKYEIIYFNNIKLFKIKNDKNHIAFIQNNVVDILDYPFYTNDIKKYIKNRVSSFLNFMNLLMPIINKEKRNLIFKNRDEFFTFLKYQKYIHWSLHLGYDNIVNYALDAIISEKLTNVKKIIPFIISHLKQYPVKYEIKSKFRDQKYKEKIKSLDIEPQYKLQIMYFVGERKDYQSLIKQTIQFYKTAKIEKKIEIKDILQEVM